MGSGTLCLAVSETRARAVARHRPEPTDTYTGFLHSAHVGMQVYRYVEKGESSDFPIPKLSMSKNTKNVEP